MQKYVYRKDNDQLICIEEAIPECGKDFCDSCGDCLSCCGSGPCFYGGEHYWVEYRDIED